LEDKDEDEDEDEQREYAALAPLYHRLKFSELQDPVA
jgi:hypothetical protein